MFLDPSDPRPPPPSPRGTPRPGRRRDEDVLILLLLIALVAFVLAPFAGGTLWAAAGALFARV